MFTTENNVDYVHLGTLLKQYREISGYTQKDISQIFKITPQSVSMWEKGKNKIDIDTLYQLCNLYKVDFSDLLKAVTETKKAPESVSPDPEAKKQAAIQHLMNALSNAGIIDRDGNMSDRDFEFLKGIVLAIRAHFDDDSQ